MPNIYFSSTRAQFGFSLIEISIVLIIIALIAGGVVAGRDLIATSNHRNIAVKASELLSSITQFQEKYRALPGDMANATLVWGRADGNSATQDNCADMDGDSALNATCNGNGNGFIASDAASTYERFRLWEHLRLGSYINGSYTGIAGGSGDIHGVSGSNVPAGIIENTAYDLIYLDSASLPAQYFAVPEYSHVLHMGMEQSGNNPPHGAIISAQVAYSMDKKIDDGLPGQGHLTTFNNTQHSNCASSDDVATARYQTQGADGMTDCTLLFNAGF